MTIENYKKAIEVVDKIGELASINCDATSLKEEIEESCRSAGSEMHFTIVNVFQESRDSQDKALSCLDIPSEIKSILKSDDGGIKSKLELTVEMQSLRIAALESAKNE